MEIELSFYTIRTYEGYYRGQWRWTRDPLKAKWFTTKTSPRTNMTQFHVSFPNEPLPSPLFVNVPFKPIRESI